MAIILSTCSPPYWVGTITLLVIINNKKWHLGSTFYPIHSTQSCQSYVPCQLHPLVLLVANTVKVHAVATIIVLI